MISIDTKARNSRYAARCYIQPRSTLARNTLKDGPLSNKGPSAFYRVGILQRKHFTAANIL